MRLKPPALALSPPPTSRQVRDQKERDSGALETEMTEVREELSAGYVLIKSAFAYYANLASGGAESGAFMEMGLTEWINFVQVGVGGGGSGGNAHCMLWTCGARVGLGLGVQPLARPLPCAPAEWRQFLVCG